MLVSLQGRYFNLFPMAPANSTTTQGIHFEKSQVDSNGPLALEKGLGPRGWLKGSGWFKEVLNAILSQWFKSDMISTSIRTSINIHQWSIMNIHQSTSTCFFAGIATQSGDAPGQNAYWTPWITVHAIWDHLSMCKISGPQRSRKSSPTRPFQQGTNWTPQGVVHFGWGDFIFDDAFWDENGYHPQPTGCWIPQASGGAGTLSTSWSKQCSKERKSVSPSPWSLPFRTLHPQFLNHGIQFSYIQIFASCNILEPSIRTY
jgi:hypothetical protein